MITKIVRVFVAIAAACGLLLSPATASASSAVTGKPTTLELDAGGPQIKIKKGNKVQIKGKLNAEGEMRELTLGLDIFAQVKVGASAWTDLYYRSCKPNSTFNMRLDLSASADLRLYFPGTSVYASATSNIVGVVVI
ncbi:hypothetical protein FKR81_41265 [Lentzea tibetensis]|uniref:Secreted protein n=1 Tax=Lentzea tibetensis TaxID=2591470 RepID=A0A563EFV3_9PSEU|nr:hypothetical protein [Lentzea tibetensis]TWP44500.1 hypothetical protein FKR81_41265 [Lentzea tibetensis]